MLRTLKKTLLASAVAILAPALAHAAPIQALSIAGPVISGNQNYTGALGIDFEVLNPISITSLGVFDADADGIAGNLSVYIFDLSNISSALVSATFSGSADPLTGQYRYKSVGTPIALGLGNYSVVAFGFGASDANGNEQAADIPISKNEGSGAISFFNSRFGSQGISPLVSFPFQNTAGNFACSGNPEACFAAGSFEYEVAAVSAIPVPAALPLFGTGLAIMGFVGWRRKRKTAA